MHCSKHSIWSLAGYVYLRIRTLKTHLRSSDLTEYPDPDSPEPCLGNVYIWRPFIPPSQKLPRQKISFLQSWWRRSVDNLCSFHLKDHLKWFACSLVILDEWAAPHFTCAVTLWWIWSRVLSRPSRPVPMAGCSVSAGQVTCIYRPVSGWHWGHYCSCVVTSLTLHH